MLRCSLCGRRAVYHQRYSGIYLCDRCFVKGFERRFRRAVVKEHLVVPGEKIAVAVSGGKDSVTCMHLLAEYCKRKNCEMVAITVDEGIEGYREKSLEVARKNAELLGIEHHVISFEKEFGINLDEMIKRAVEKKTGLGPCTYCGILRRSLLNKAAKQVGANKVATGHNLDDEAQAIMLNYIRGDLARLYRLGPAYAPLEGFVPRIKPLREIPEKEIALYAFLKGIEVDLSTCPYRGEIHSEVRDFLNRLEENHPNSKFMVVRMFDKMKPHLEKIVPEFVPKKCKVCGEPTSGEICKSCELLRVLKN
ncbi:MAG: TIGR00269 family protein [Candidatus Hadarchaeales archaeon]